MNKEIIINEFMEQARRAALNRGDLKPFCLLEDLEAIARALINKGAGNSV